MKEEKYAKKITKRIGSKEQSTKSKETKDSVSPKETKSKADSKASMPNKTANKSAVQSTKAPDYNAAMAMVNEDKKRRAQKKKNQAIATGVVAGAVVVTAIVVPAVYFTRSVDLNISIPNIQDSQQYELSVKRGYKIGDLQPKEIEGYTFEGFYKDANLTERYSDDDKITKDITIYAKYTANVYAITFPSSPYFTIEGEDIENNKAYAEYDTEYSFRVNLSAGYTESDIHVYLGETELIPVDGVYTITIKGDSTINITGVEINTYSVVYYDEDAETIIHSEEVDYNTASTYTDTPEKPADNTYTYTFSGWIYYDSGEPITDELTHVINNIKVKASYTATYIEYTIGNIPTQVTIQKGSETLTSSDTLHYGDELEITYTPTTGYDMASFNVSGATLVSGDTYRITGNLTVTYTETIQIYTITIESSNTEYGTVDEATLSISYGTTYQVEGNDLVFSNGARVTPTPASSDAQYTYTFTGWSETSGTITGEETLTAIFTRAYVEYSIDNPYTQVTIKRDGETLTSESTIHYGDELEITYTPTEGYEMTTFTVTGADRVDETDTYTVTGNLEITYAEELVAEYLDFTIENGVITGYTGTDTNVVIPSTYSLGNMVELREFTITSSFLENPATNLDQILAMYMGDFYVTPNNGERSELMNFTEFADSYMSTLTEDSFPLKIEQTYSLAIESPEDESGQILVSLPDMETQFERTLSGTLTYTDASSETGESEYTFDSGTSLMSWLMSVASDEESLIAMFPMTVNFDPIAYGEIIEGTDYAVTGIAERAFAGNTSIESVVLPDSITTIPSYAFADCVNLKSINIPKDVTTLGAFIFDGCTSLETVVYDAINCVNYGFESKSQYNTPLFNNPFQNVNPNVEIVISSNVKILPGYFLAYRTMSGSNTIEESVQVSKVELEDNSQIEYIGSYAFYECTVPTNIILTNVTSIGGYAFSDCSNLTTVTFGENSQLTSIGSYVFSGCSSLTSIAIPSSVTSIGGYAFSGCSSLTSITIPEGVTSIGDGAFSGCSNLPSITIPESVTSIGFSAFYGCSNLTDVYYSGDINDWVSIPFGGYETNPLSNGANLYLNGDTTIPVTEINIDTATSIGAYSFYGCNGLTKVTIGDQVTSIGNRAFSDCSSLTSITIPSSVTSIGIGAFDGCSSLTTVTFGENSQLTRIGDNTFSGCASLTNITIPENVTSIEYEAFYNCTGLTEINFNATNMPDLSSYNYVFYDAGKNGSGITVNIGANVTRIPAYLFNPSNSGYSPNIISVNFEEGSQCSEIGEYAFYYCSSLTSITIPENVTSIGSYAFFYCSSLADVYYSGDINDWVSISFGSYDANPLSYGENLYLNGDNTTPVTEINIDTATSIGAYSLYSYDKLTKVTIGDQVTSIGYQAFYGCHSLVEVINLSNVTFNVGDYGTSTSDNPILEIITEEIDSQLTTINGNVYKDYNGERYFIMNIDGSTEITIDSSATQIYQRAFNNRSDITTVIIPEGVTSIGNYAFYGCSSLTNITIPSGVTSIGRSAFSHCGNLDTVTFGENSQLLTIGEYAFSGCSSLTSITIPSSVTSIGEYAFDICYSLVEVVNLSSVTFNVGDYGTSTSNNSILEIITDEANSKLVTINGNVYKNYNGERYFITNIDDSTEITIDSSATQIYQYAFYNRSDITSVTIPSSVTSIGQRAFYSCSSLTSITIPSSVTSIGGSAFYNCTGLTEINFNATNMSDLYSYNYVFYNVGEAGTGIVVNIGANVTRIPAYLFYSSGSYSPNIISVNFEEDSQCTEIGTCAFSSCSSLTSITIPESVTSIGNGAFSSCSSLTSITIPESVTSIGNGAFSSCSSLQYNIYEGGLYLGNTENPYIVLMGTESTDITEFTIHIGCKLINECAFQFCSSLTTVTFGENSQLTSIGDYAFSSCSSLTSIIIPSSVTSIGDGAFSVCSSLTSISIPSSVTSIGNYAFQSCSNLQYNIYEGGLYLGNTENPYLVLVDTEVTNVVEFTIHSDCKIILYEAFSGCSNLTSVIIPEGVTSIGDGAFSGCSSLTSITIPSSVTSIGSYAFSRCSGLTSVTFENTSGWYRTTSSTATSGTDVTVTDPAQNATYLTSTYAGYYWKRNA